MTTNFRNAAYRLMNTGRTQTAIFSSHKVVGKRYKVDVKNSVAPYDALVVDGWTCKDRYGVWRFRFDDGDLGTVVELPLWMAEHQMLNPT